MIQWDGKDINKLSDDELWAAIISCANIYNFRFDKLKDPRMNKPKHRLNKIFKANPPAESESFTNLCNELQSEWTKRNKQNG